MIALDVQTDAVSWGRFFREMSRRDAMIREGLCGRGRYGGGIVEVAAVKLITGLRAGTARSKEKREIIPNPLLEMARMDAFGKGMKLRTATREARAAHYPWAVRFDWRRVKGGTPLFGGSFLPVRGKKKAHANASPLRTIRKRGLAKSSWAWMLKALGKGGATEQPQDLRLADSRFVGRNIGGETIGTWIGRNRVHYMRKALTRSITASVHAAATMFREDTERLLAKATAGQQAA